MDAGRLELLFIPQMQTPRDQLKLGVPARAE